MPSIPTVEIGGIVYDLKDSTARKMMNKALPFPKLNEVDIDAGEEGQILRSMGNGLTEWADAGAPSQKQIKEALDAWLDDHPEAVTSVADQSITAKKIKNGELSYVTPEMFGAVGDGVADDTEAVQQCMRQACKHVVFSKNYLVTLPELHGGCIIPQDGSDIEFINGSVVKLNNPNNYVAGGLILIAGVSNVRIHGNGKLIGDRATNTGTGEWLAGIQIGDAKNIVIEGLTITECFGDGICLDGATTGTVYSENVVIRNVTVDYNRRNGISVVSAIGVKIVDCVFKNTSGINPQFGIDYETNSANDRMRDMVLSNCSFEGNARGDVNFYSHDDHSGLIMTNCKCNHIVSFNIMGEKSYINASNCIVTPRSGSYAFGVSSNDTSSITISDCKIFCENAPANAVTWGYHTSHKNITFRNLGVIGGRFTDRFALHWDATDELDTNIYFEYWLDGITAIPNLDLGIIPNPFHPSNTIKVMSVEPQYMNGPYANGLYPLHILEKTGVQTNIDIVSLSTIEYRIFNNSGENHYMMPGIDYINVYTGDVEQHILIENGHSIWIQYDPMTKKRKYYLT